MGDISTHVISKLGKDSVAGSSVKVYYNQSADASPFDQGWELVNDAALSENGGNDTLVAEGKLQKGLYSLQYDFKGVDAAARAIYKKEGEEVMQISS